MILAPNLICSTTIPYDTDLESKIYVASHLQNNADAPSKDTIVGFGRLIGILALDNDMLCKMTDV